MARTGLHAKKTEPTKPWRKGVAGKAAPQISPFAGMTDRQLQRRIIDLEDMLAITETRGEPVFPTEVLEQILNGEHPVGVYRKYRAMTQRDLAKKADISATYLSEIESGLKGGSANALKAIADVLNVPMENLITD